MFTSFRILIQLKEKQTISKYSRWTSNHPDLLGILRRRPLWTLNLELSSQGSWKNYRSPIQLRLKTALQSLQVTREIPSKNKKTSCKKLKTSISKLSCKNKWLSSSHPTVTTAKNGELIESALPRNAGISICNWFVENATSMSTRMHRQNQRSILKNISQN